MSTALARRNHLIDSSNRRWPTGVQTASADDADRPMIVCQRLAGAWLHRRRMVRRRTPTSASAPISASEPGRSLVDRRALRHLLQIRPGRRAGDRPRRPAGRNRRRRRRTPNVPARRVAAIRRSAARSSASASASCGSFSTSAGRTPSISATCSRTARSAPTSTSRRWCRSISPSSAATGAGKSSAVALILREIMAARRTCASC